LLNVIRSCWAFDEKLELGQRIVADVEKGVK
jgi:hypothetical protein